MSFFKEATRTSSDFGSEVPQFRWHPRKPLLAVVGSNSKVLILNRSGELQHQFVLPGVVDFEWDAFSDNLALVTGRLSTIYIYSHDTTKLNPIETKCKDLTLIRWSKKVSLLAVGSQDGSIIIFNQATRKRLPTLDTHSQSIIDAVWTGIDNKLVTLGMDRIMAISDAEGKALSMLKLDAPPRSLALLELPALGTSPAMSLVVCNLRNSLFVANLCANETFHAEFPAKTGSIDSIAGAENGLLLGFESGVVSFAMPRPNELIAVDNFKASKHPITHIASGSGNGLATVISNNTLHTLTVSSKSLKEDKKAGIVLPTDAGNPVRTQWSPDGQSVAIATTNASLHIYTVKVQDISTSWANLLFTIVSPNLIGVKDIQEGKILCNIPVDTEFEAMAAGMESFAVYAGNKVHYYSYYVPHLSQLQVPDPGKALPAAQDKAGLDGPNTKFIRTVTYMSTVKDLKVNSAFAAVLFDERARLHLKEDPTETVLTLPSDAAEKALAIGLSEALFVCATNTKVYAVALPKMQVVVEHKARIGLKKAFPNPSCTRMIYIDDNNELFMLNLVTEVAFVVQGYVKGYSSILWDWADPTVFVAYNHEKLITFVYSPHSRHGSSCEVITERHKKDTPVTTSIFPNSKPISLFNGSLILQYRYGATTKIKLETHQEVNTRGPNTVAFYKNFSLNRLRQCSQNISSLQEADQLVVKALHLLDIELAIRIYRQLSQPNLVLYLEKIKHIQEKNLLIGHISMIMGSFDDAQKYFLDSSQPLRALEMRRDLMHWEQALNLAKQLAPSEIPIISKEYAQQLEYQGEYMTALELFRRGKRVPPTGHACTELSAAQEEVVTHNLECMKGVARCYLRTGRLKEGMSIALDINDGTFAFECAKLCEDNQRFDEAAKLFERAGEVEKAAVLYIEKCNNLKAAASLLAQIKSPGIIGRYAHAKEMEGSFREAEEAYAQAEDWDNVVRIKVEKLNDLQGAYLIVQRTRSTNAAALVAKTCEDKKEYSSAVEFLVVAKQMKEAFELAKEHDCLSSYENALLSQAFLKDGVASPANQDDFLVLANYYNGLRKPGQAAIFYRLAGNFTLALNKFIESGQSDDIEKAIEVVGKARSDALTNRLIDFLMGESDGDPKDPSYIFRLYMALGSYEKASKTSVIIAAKEQEAGNYKAAHKTLVEACCILREKNIRVPSDLRRSLMILHSYLIVKDLIAVMRDDVTASRMLLRAAHNIQKFHTHAATIIAAAVLQCSKSGFASSAFQLSCILIQNERYRVQISEKNRRKIESIVRRGAKEAAADPVESTTPCPFCDQPVPECELDCGACRNNLPFCIVTGKHIVRSDFTKAPCCGFPAIYSALAKRLTEKSSCPMCETILDINKVLLHKNPDLEGL